MFMQNRRSSGAAGFCLFMRQLNFQWKFDCQRDKQQIILKRGIYYGYAKKMETSYKEVMIGKTLYRVTSIFTGEKDLGKTLEQLAIRRAMVELTHQPSES